MSLDAKCVRQALLKVRTPQELLAIYANLYGTVIEVWYSRMAVASQRKLAAASAIQRKSRFSGLGIRFSRIERIARSRRLRYIYCAYSPRLSTIYRFCSLPNCADGKAAMFTVVSGTEIKATVPSGATTRTDSVVTPTGTLASNPQLVVQGSGCERTQDRKPLSASGSALAPGEKSLFHFIEDCRKG